MLIPINIHEVEGVHFAVPNFLINRWPTRLALNEFPRFCGAGDSFSERIVPDKNWGLNISSACFIHDLTHLLFPKTPFYFHMSNMLLLVNVLHLVRVKTRLKLIRILREHRALNYYIGVETDIGYGCFQEYNMSGSAKQAELKRLMMKVGVELTDAELVEYTLQT